MSRLQVAARHLAHLNSSLRPTSTQLFHKSFVYASRTMSTSGPTLHQFMVYAPDKTDEGAFERRLSVRERHLAGAKSLHNSGKLKLGGALLSPESILGADAPKMVGSTMIFEASSLEEVKKVIESDIYYTSGVWDPEKLVILPFAGAPL